MKARVAVLPGDGIGPEVSEATRRVLEASGARFKWEIAYAGAEALEEFGAVLPEATMASIRKNRVAIKGPVTTPVGSGFRSINVALRKRLDLYVCLRPIQYFKGVPSPLKEPEKTNMVIFRENSEDIYAGVEWKAESPEVCSAALWVASSEVLSVKSKPL